MILSASQINTYADCPRKWAWRVVHKIQGAPSPSAEVGTAVHQELERWLTGGGPPDLERSVGGKPVGRIAAEALPHLPPPTGAGGLNLEVERKFLIEIEGFKFQGFVDLAVGDKVYDHKTISDFCWALSPEQLLGDTQANLYAAERMHRLSLPYVNLQWTYLRTRGKPKAQPTIARATRGSVERVFDRKILPLAQEITELVAQKPEAKDLEPRIEACERYGGCPFREHCNLTPREIFRGKMSQLTLKEKIEKKKAEQAAKAAQETAIESGTVLVKTDLQTPAPLSVNPPESAKPPEVVESPEAAEGPPPAEELPKRGRGRPKGSKNKPRDMVVTKEMWPPEGLTLYINCAPLKGCSGAVLFRQFIDPLLQRTAGELELDDYRFAEYGRGPTLLQQALKQHLENSCTPETVVIDTTDQVAQHALPVLQEFATTVVRGL